VTQLVKYDEARRALQEAHSTDEVLLIRDVHAAKAAAAKIAGDKEFAFWAKAIVLRSERRLGEMLAEQKATVGLNQGAVPGKTGTKGAPVLDDRPTLASVGIDKKLSARAQKLATVAEADFERYLRETQRVGRELTSAGVYKLAKQTRPKQRHYSVGREYCTVADLAALAQTVPEFGTVYADPPWAYGNQGTRASTGDHYVGLTVDEICSLPVAALGAVESHLHLWTTNAFLFDAKRVMEAWGYTYKSCFVWVKPQIGMGNYWRVSHEFLLLGVRGVLTFPDKSLRSWGEFKRGQHSAKPERIRDLIHKASPGPRIELFARRAVEGWTCWGNEIRREVFAA
jgi:N6-adenosine-specific RNA methylase IME4